jgi:2-deoxystreptamine N-acetyl-D-glucosaminyltransferase/2-deoxystreptamine glucosyltransferase
VLTERVRRALGGGGEVTPDVVEPAPRAPRGRTPEPVVAYVGRVSAEKGWPALLRIAEALPEVRLLVVGDGPDLPALRAQATARGISARMTLTGAVAAEEVPAALATAHVLVLPSEHEELGSVLIEAMAAGLPSVAYAVGGVPEAIVDGVTGILVPPGDAAALAAAVARALGDEDLLARAREEGPRRASERHGVEAASRRLVALYEELARR